MVTAASKPTLANWGDFSATLWSPIPRAQDYFRASRVDTEVLWRGNGEHNWGLEAQELLGPAPLRVVVNPAGYPQVRA
jgi:hypothetical protein